MKKEFNLSKEIWDTEFPSRKMINAKDVKEFIKRLKEMKICSYCKRHDCGHDGWMMVSLNNLDKLAGDKLT